MRGVAVALAAVTSLALVASCAGTELSPPPRTVTAVAVPDPPAVRRGAGLPDCAPGQATAPTVGGLPDLTLRCLGGDLPVRLTTLRGPMVVNLWATWCTPCRTEGPLLAQFAADSDGKIALLGVNTADPDPALAAEFARAVGWRYQQLQDPGHSLPDALGMKGLPLTLFVDEKGAIVYRHLGAFQSTQQIKDLTWQYLGVSR